MHLLHRSGGWVAGAEMSFPWFKALRAAKNFRWRGCSRSSTSAPRRGAARPDITTSRVATVDREGEREPLRPAAKRGSAPACNDGENSVVVPLPAAEIFAAGAGAAKSTRLFLLEEGGWRFLGELSSGLFSVICA